jgi:uncharacterized membrane protein
MEYAPGNCNIGPTGIQRRYRIGYLGLLMMLIFILCAEVFYLPRIWKLFLFIPAFYAFSGFMQGWKKFCYVYGLKGLHRMADQPSYKRVSDDPSFRKDQYAAINLLSMVLLCSIIVTVLYYCFF